MNSHPDQEARIRMLNDKWKHYTKLKIKKINPQATVPTKVNESDAGYDLYCVDEKHKIAPHSQVLINTGIAMQIPDGCVGLIWPRSGLAAKNGIDVFAGVIDSGYRDEIKVILYNSSDKYCFIDRGDRIAQILIQKVENYAIEEVDNLNDSARGLRGFGSSGK